MLLLGILIATSVGCRDQAGPRVPAHGYVTGAGGARIFYEVVGAGDDTVVVVHGGPGAGINDSRPDLEPLAKSHVVIFYDQRGGGRSELPDTTLLTPQYFVGDLEAVREHFNLDQMSLIAQSFGAIVVAEYLRAHPHRAARMVFSSPHNADYLRYAPRVSGEPPEMPMLLALRTSVGWLKCRHWSGQTAPRAGLAVRTLTGRGAILTLAEPFSPWTKRTGP